MAASPMASNIRLLLRLPASLRHSILSGRSARFASNGQCSFIKTSSSRIFASTKNSPPPRNGPKSAKKSSGQYPAPSSQPLPARSSPKGPSTPPQPTPVHSRGSAVLSRINTIAPNLERVLLYTAPRHGSFFAMSYIAGSIFVVGGYLATVTFIKDEPGKPKLKWWAKATAALPAFFFAIIGTTFILAPMKMIKSIAIVTQNGGRILRFEVKRKLPFMKPDIMETPVSKVVLDRGISSASTNVKIHNVPLSEAKAFTESYLSKSQDASHNGGVLSRLSSFNKSLVNAWPAFKRDIGRMWLRESMAYVRIEGNGNFKVDLQGCSLLDEGKPLQKLINIDPDQKQSVWSWLQRMSGA
ncbi:hypothetical protein M409DRAFT_50031 [Zasmidium cellare ATCC 36951]|uniref:Uncharacterized protein n=1 Tax=Zasmidium cellare ATCC 36951 TaxID=1080233 RepID=A0A6A6CZX7_ZASCE|nr:uncharacterized protein M409DRAFT_50031 [Zasmidium cellare ATCC 36951]KAF2172313.1 hypothetical protein M409DRAFT_50031 [Zasmidium cellare ATCC 36951]